MVDAVLEILPCMTNMTDLVLIKVHLTPKRLKHIRNIKKLRSLTIHYCDISMKSDHVPWSITHLEICNFFFLKPRPDLWVFLNPNCIKSIVVYLEPLPLVPAGQTFLHLRNLQITAPGYLVHSSVPFLAHCPLLETLALVPQHKTMYFPEIDISHLKLPALKSYTGIAWFAPPLARGSHLEYVSLFCTMDAPITQLRIMQRLLDCTPDLQRLHFETTYLTRTLFEIMSAFPHLIELHIDLARNDFPPPTIDNVIRTRTVRSVLISSKPYDFKPTPRRSSFHALLNFRYRQPSRTCRST